MGSKEEYLECVGKYYLDYLLIPDEQINSLSEKLTRVSEISSALPMR
jgi:hypothetical protein